MTATDDLSGATDGFKNYLAATREIVTVAESVSKAFLSGAEEFSAKVRELNIPKSGGAEPAWWKSHAEPLQRILAFTKAFLNVANALRAQKEADEKAGNFTSNAVNMWPKVQVLAAHAQRIQKQTNGVIFVEEWAVVM